ncbi:hypothetical protein KUCAC02_032637, partial [Chaenocephalus aceratus]
MNPISARRSAEHDEKEPSDPQEHHYLQSAATWREMSGKVVSVEAREALIGSLVQEAELRAADLSSQAQREGLSLEACQKDKTLKAWEWRSKLYRRMRAGFLHARAPEAPSVVRLSVSSSSSLSVNFQEPQSLNSTVITKYRVEWSCLQDFSLLAGEMLLENLSLRATISNLTTGRLYYVRGSAYNMRGWGASSRSFTPLCGSLQECEVPRRRGHIEAMERLLQQVRATHTHYCCTGLVEAAEPQQEAVGLSESQTSLQLLQQVREDAEEGVYLAVVLHHKDSLLVTAEDQIPIVEVDDSYKQLPDAGLSCGSP